MINQGIMGKLITGLLILSLFISPVLCAEDFTVNVVVAPNPLLIISVSPDDDVQLKIDEGQTLNLVLNLSANTEWFVDGELVLTQLGTDTPFYYFEPSSSGVINVTSSSINIVSPFNIVTHTWWIDIDKIYYVISPIRPVLPPEDEEKEEEEEERSFIADIIDDVTPPYTGIFDSNIIYVIENALESINQTIMHMMTFVSTGNNWFALMFGYMGVMIAGMLSKKDNIAIDDMAIDIIFIGSVSIVVVLTLNAIFSILSDSFVINSFIFLLSCGSIAMIMFNLKEIQEIPGMLEA